MFALPEVIVARTGKATNDEIRSIISLYDGSTMREEKNAILYPISQAASLFDHIQRNTGEYNEKITTTHCRLFIDYDNDSPWNTNYVNTIINLIDSSIIRVIKAYNYDLVNSEQISINLESFQEKYMYKTVVRNKNKGKTSIHIVYPRIVFDIASMKTFVEYMKNQAENAKDLSHIDTAVYRKNLSLRTVYSIKNGDYNEMLKPMSVNDNTRSIDYFITVCDEDVIVPLNNNTQISSNLLGHLTSIFKPNVITNRSAIMSFVTDLLRETQEIKITYNHGCQLCGEYHNRPFYVKKQRQESEDGNPIYVYHLHKNGKCSGLERTNNKILVHGVSQQGSSSQDIEYRVASDIYSKGMMRVTNDGIFIWSTSDNKWKPIKKQELGNYIISYKSEVPNITPDALKAIDNAYSRRCIIDNLYDMASKYEFATPEASFTMFKNGLVDLKTMKFIPNARDYNIQQCMNADFVEDITNLTTEESNRDKEWSEIISMIAGPLYPGIPNDEKERRMTDLSRLEQVFGSLLFPRCDPEVFHFYGRRDGAKSFILDILLQVFGSYGHKGTVEIIQDKRSSTTQALAAYEGKRLVLLSELTAYTVIEEQRFKTITEDYMTADTKYHDPKTFYNGARTIIDSNYLLDIKSTDSSIDKRLQSFHFKSRFDPHRQEDNDYVTRVFKRDPLLKQKARQGYFNEVVIRYMRKCYTKYYGDKDVILIIPYISNTLIHQARAIELWALIDANIILRSNITITICDKYLTHSDIFIQYCPLLSSLLSRGDKKQSNDIGLAINVLDNVRSSAYIKIPSQPTSKKSYI